MTTSRSDWVTTARERTVAAIREGRIEDALAGVDAIWAEGRPIHDFYGDMKPKNVVMELPQEDRSP